MLKDTLKALRVSKGLTKKQVARGVGIGERAYIAYEYGERDVSTETLLKLADFYGVTTDYLLGREPAPDPFAEFEFSEADEKDMYEKFQKLPAHMRACVLAVVKALGSSQDKDPDSSIKPTPPLRMTQGQLIARRTDGVYENRQATPEELKKLDLIKDDPPPDF